MAHDVGKKGVFHDVMLGVELFLVVFFPIGLLVYSFLLPSFLVFLETTNVVLRRHIPLTPLS
jgi:hypothetical protein